MNLTIRKMRETDLQALHQLLSDSRVMAYLEPPFSLAETRHFLETKGLSSQPAILAVEKEDGQFIGYVIYHAYDKDSMEIGWVLASSFWGMGYAGNLTGQLIAMAQAENKDAVIECVPQQKATRAIALKYGFSDMGESEGLVVYRLKCSR